MEVTFITSRPEANGQTHKKWDFIAPQGFASDGFHPLFNSRNKWQQLLQGIIQEVPDLIVLKVNTEKVES